MVEGFITFTNKYRNDFYQINICMLNGSKYFMGRIRPLDDDGDFGPVCVSSQAHFMAAPSLRGALPSLPSALHDMVLLPCTFTCPRRP